MAQCQWKAAPRGSCDRVEPRPSGAAENIRRASWETAGAAPRSWCGGSIGGRRRARTRCVA
eukprot:6465449-Prymnesium_polylepis.1